MTVFNKQVEKQRQAWLAVYQGLSEQERTVVRALSVISEPVARTPLAQILSKLKILAPSGKPFKPGELDALFGKALKAELLVQKDNYLSCHPLFSEVPMRDALKSGDLPKLAEAARAILPVTAGWGGRRHFSNSDRCWREARIAFYRRDWTEAEKCLAEGQAVFGGMPSAEDFYSLICMNPFEREWVKGLPPEHFENVLRRIIRHALQYWELPVQPLALLEELCAGPRRSDGLCALLAEVRLLRGEFAAADALLQGAGTPELLALQGWRAFLSGAYAQSLEHYDLALALLKKSSRKRKVYFQGTAGVFLVLALLKSGTPEHLRAAAGHVEIARGVAPLMLRRVYVLLEALVEMLQGDLSLRAKLAATPIFGPEETQGIGAGAALGYFENFFLGFIKYWTDAESAKQCIHALAAHRRLAEENGYAWLAGELAVLLAELDPKGTYPQARTFCKASGSPGLAGLLQPQAPWEVALNALAGLTAAPPAGAARQTAQPEFRLVWLLDFDEEDHYLAFHPREQKLTASGAWSKGRNIALKRLREELANFAYFTEQDRRVCGHLREEQEHGYGYYYTTTYSFDQRAVLDLAGHPLLFWVDAPGARVELVKSAPELLVTRQKNDKLKLQLQPDSDGEEIRVIKESPSRLRAVQFSAEHLRIQDILGDGLEVPETAKERVLAAISGIAPLVTVHSDIGGGLESAEPVPADPTPRVHLLPAGAGLKAAVLVRPFAGGGPYYPPGGGGETLIAEVDGKRLQTTRALKQEKKLAAAVVDACPTLARTPQENGEWLLEEPQDCLELLLELQALGERAAIEWPQGERFKLAGQAGMGQLQASIRRQQNWFELSGQVQVGEGQVLDMQRLLQLLAHSQGRFVQLENGQFLALTQEFRKRLDDLRAYAEEHGKGVRFHPLAALALEDFTDEIGQFKADKHWREHLARLQEVEHYQPALPSTFQAELRAYQYDGFAWLARLAHWGVGACLADDMGLGKTIQALAALLLHAPRGPSLVVAPTSVCMNWQVEAERFAPTLRVILFGAGDRQKTLDALQPYDLLVCSYGLLQQEQVAELLAKVEFQMVILDEAQAIKNTGTKRSQGAMNLQGAFRLITTGTPVENHLGELWNLFRFINPGLLGSLESFNKRFAGPIERNQDRQARLHLKKLIQPFILRRTKSQVLEELPPRTEILLHVELGKEETALYEALRREALEKLARGGDLPAGQRHLQILSEIMRLRRACCNAALVMPDSNLPSAKLEAFGEILEELLENKHKALVFSQFVDHLSILRAYLEQRGVRYQYLDGGTPAKDRRQRVEAFQAGEGDVFLISLKAGGVGLNLTAADYVIHMDPWWNPAVEDQASDRAHRIGQQRPVTIYRLVAKNTIEEKIVDLHQHKRDLADSLLEGADMSGKVSADELLRLMREQ